MFWVLIAIIGGLGIAAIVTMGWAGIGIIALFLVGSAALLLGSHSSSPVFLGAERMSDWMWMFWPLFSLLLVIAVELSRIHTLLSRWRMDDQMRKDREYD
jgi:hypothetical protein